MGQIGQRLVQARTAKGLSLEQVQEITKIRLKYLVALEDEDWQALPGEVYLRGFLKSYAQVVGLDPVEMLTLYQPTPPPQPELEPIPVKTASIRTSAPSLDRPLRNSTRKPSGGYHGAKRRLSEGGSRGRLPALVLGIMIIGIVCYFGYRAWQPPATVAPPAATGSIGGSQATPAPNTSSATGNDPLNTAPTPTEPAVQLIKQNEAQYEVRYLVKTSQSLQLKVGIKATNPGEAVGECWIDVQSDSRNVGDMMLRSGLTKEYTAIDTIRLRIGNPQVAGLLMSVNGIEIPRPQTNEALDLVITRQTP